MQRKINNTTTTKKPVTARQAAKLAKRGETKAASKAAITPVTAAPEKPVNVPSAFAKRRESLYKAIGRHFPQAGASRAVNDRMLSPATLESYTERTGGHKTTVDKFNDHRDKPGIAIAYKIAGEKPHNPGSYCYDHGNYTRARSVDYMQAAETGVQITKTGAACARLFLQHNPAFATAIDGILAEYKAATAG